ncbi:MAG: YjfB family protein [Oscillospiraceae bacterium]|nr:YjfB family protein [Oscillospiraceae bacterium]
MELSTSIAEMSMIMSQTQVQQQVGTSMLKKAMDTSSELALGAIEMLDNSSAQTFAGDIGAIFDARA